MKRLILNESLLKRIMLLAVLNFLVSLSFIPKGYSAEPFGTDLGNFDGVAAYSNCSNYCVDCNNKCNDLNYIDGTYIGIKWQCVEYVRRYYYEVFDLDLASKLRGDAKTFYDHASDMGLNRYANGGNIPPQVGDILVSEGTDANVGHVAIVRSVTDNQVCTIQQNFSNDSRDIERYLTLNVSNGNYTVSGFGESYPIAGWLRSSGQPRTTTTTTTTNEGLVAYYPFNGNANDESGNGNDGIGNGVALTTDRNDDPDSAYSFGTGNYIRVYDDSSLDITDAITLAAWIYRASATTGWQSVFCKGDTSSKDSPYAFLLQYNKLELLLNRTRLVGSMDIPINQWIHIATTWDGSVVKFYVNGIEDSKTAIYTTKLSTIDGNFLIGSDPPGNTDYFFGKIDEGYIYNRALSASEILSLYGGDQPTINPTIAQEPMSGSPGTTFTQWGTGFTPISTATLHFEMPNGTEYPTAAQSIDSTGHFEITYTVPEDKPAGTYTWWAIDGETGIKSNEVSYVIIWSPTSTTSAPPPTTISTTSTSSTTTAFIPPCGAEAIYGEESEETELLRYYRDNVLSKTPEGRELIKLYYLWSPTIVRAMEQDEEFKEELKQMLDGGLMMMGMEAD